MHLRRLAVADFRSWERAELDLEPGVSVLVGPNGVGKTNLVEAVGYLATLGSHRVASDAPLVRRGAERAVVRATVVHLGRELTVELEIAPGRANRARVNRAPVARPRDVLGILRTVLFAPEDLALVRGDPGERRRFLDDLLVARRPRFAAVRADYDRVLKQRVGAAQDRPQQRPILHGRGSPYPGRVGRPSRPARCRAAGRAPGPGRRPRRAGRRGVRRGRAVIGADRARLPLVAGRGAARHGGRAGAAAARRARHGCAARRSSGVCVSSARTATIWSCGSARARRRGTRATASRGRWPSRCGWPPTGCCVRTASNRC